VEPYEGIVAFSLDLPERSIILMNPVEIPFEKDKCEVTSWALDGTISFHQIDFRNKDSNSNHMSSRICFSPVRKIRIQQTPKFRFEDISQITKLSSEYFIIQLQHGFCLLTASSGEISGVYDKQFTFPEMTVDNACLVSFNQASQEILLIFKEAVVKYEIKGNSLFSKSFFKIPSFIYAFHYIYLPRKKSFYLLVRYGLQNILLDIESENATTRPWKDVGLQEDLTSSMQRI
jgi:hypothetical protein